MQLDTTDQFIMWGMWAGFFGLLWLVGKVLDKTNPDTDEAPDDAKTDFLKDYIMNRRD